MIQKLGFLLLGITLALLTLAAPTVCQAGAARTLSQQEKADAALLSLWPNDSEKYYSEVLPKVTVAQVDAALKNGANINARNTAGVSSLMAASGTGNVSCVKFLVSRGANVNAHDADGWTALMFACTFSTIDCAAFLISKGAYVDARTNEGQTALAVEAQALMEESLMANASAGHVVPVVADQASVMDCIKLLISKGANVNARDNNGGTALMLAATGDAAGNEECVKLLLSKGADVNAKDMDGDTALMQAASAYWTGNAGSTANCVNLLISKGAEVNVKDNNGKSHRLSQWPTCDDRGPQGSRRAIKIKKAPATSTRSRAFA